MPKAIHFHNDTYIQDYYYLKGFSREQVEKSFNVVLDGSAGVTLLRDGVIFIWIEKLKGMGYSNLSHECLHATNFTFNLRGIKISTKHDEPQAYLLGWIYEQCRKAEFKNTYKNK